MNQHEHWMQEVLTLARQGAGHVAPNPMVGAIIIKDNQVIGRGYHRQFGQAHAEVNAIEDAYKNTGSLIGTTLVVNLEPCSHYGKTPPCCRAIVEAGIRVVVMAMRDPNPLVAGRGVRYLRDQGVEVIESVLEEEARRLNEAFIHHIVTKRPYVTMKTAMTLDGKIACPSGDSKWISSQASRTYVHQLRQESAGIMVGIETILKDDAQLTTRLGGDQLSGVISHPIPIILDSKGRMPLDASVLRSKDHKEVIIATSQRIPSHKERDLIDLGCTVYKLPDLDGKVDLDALMATLGARGINSILLEGGGTLNFSALETGIVSKVISFISPKLIGGSTSKTPVEGRGICKMSDAIKLRDLTVRQINEDVVIEGYICLQD
jgi:diaminohydroxyphosphoribosylaminopyrimidine deaminase/5-amino-6-(5-phosphoribosylamino)uracil reductase